MIIIFSWIVVAGLARFLERTWWSPGSFLALVLCLSAIGTTIFAPEYYMSLNANLYLQVLVIITSVAATLGQRLATAPRQPVSSEMFVIRRKISFFFYGLAASLLSAFFTFQTTGVGLGELTSPVAVMRAAQRTTYQRYTEGFDFPILYNFSNALVLSYAIAAAVHFAAIRRLEWRLVIPLLIYVGSNMLITTRAPILFMLLSMVFASVYTTMLTSESGRFVPLSNRGVFKIALGIALFVGGIFFLFQILRFGEESTRSVGDVWAHLRRWPWGSLSAFSLWFDEHRRATVDTVPGYYTFMGIYDHLGIAARQQGAYADYILLGRGELTNVYTVFRGLYHDFGPVGSGLLLCLLGIFGGIIVRGNGSRPYVSISIYVAIMTFMAWAFVVSVWAYTANIAALMVLPLVLKYFSAPSSQRAYAEAGMRRHA